MLRRKRCRLDEYPRFSQSLILRRRRNLQRDRSQGDTRNRPMSSSSVFCCSEDDLKEAVERSGTAVAFPLCLVLAGEPHRFGQERASSPLGVHQRQTLAPGALIRRATLQATAIADAALRVWSRCCVQVRRIHGYRQEAGMSKSSKTPHHGSASCCAVCGGKFGLIRYYCWRTALCSRKCVDRFRVRREADHRWLRWLRSA